MSRIAIVIHSFDRGGSGKVAAYLARGFADAGHEVELLVFVPGGAIEPIVLPGLAGIPVRYMGRPTRWRPVDLAKGVPALVAALRRSRPDIVLAAANNAAIATATAFRIADVPGSRLFLKTTNPIASSRHRGIARSVRLAGYRAIFPWVRGVLTLSDAEAEEMAEAFPRFAQLFRAVANPYVTPAMLAGAPPTRDRGIKTVIAVARLTAQKRLERLVEAFALVRTPRSRLVMLGDGEDRERLAERVCVLGLRKRVDMPGHVADVVPALHAADLFVLTSDYEGLPAAVLEAMAANCPVLSTPCFPSARSLLAAEGCGVIEDTGPEALARQIDAHLARPRPAALRAVAERYTIAAGIAAHLEAIGATNPGTGARPEAGLDPVRDRAWDGNGGRRDQADIPLPAPGADSLPDVARTGPGRGAGCGTGPVSEAG